MIICICHRVSDRDIHRAVDEGIESFEDLQTWTRAGTQCGRCREAAGGVFEAALACPGRGCGVMTAASGPSPLPVAVRRPGGPRPGQLALGPAAA